jgi:hypothetical protein
MSRVYDILAGIDENDIEPFLNRKERTRKKEIIGPASQRALLHEACMGYLMASNG